ncbi:hypothetical protein NKH19_22360 [Mesorhizobium sp. M1338]|uniref:hypothetical protein n=1 Tax=unclassified Mesorhizobium TaxID=325217 RepID=UPI00333AEC86
MNDERNQPLRRSLTLVDPSTPGPAAFPQAGFFDLSKILKGSEQQVNCQKLDDQQNGAHRAPKGIASPVLADILIGLECFYPERLRGEAKANGDRHRGGHDCITR